MSNDNNDWLELHALVRNVVEFLKEKSGDAGASAAVSGAGGINLTPGSKEVVAAAALDSGANGEAAATFPPSWLPGGTELVATAAGVRPKAAVAFALARTSATELMFVMTGPAHGPARCRK